MTSGLLEKEKEFRKLNEELEIQTKELMNEVDVVMKIQDTLSNELIKPDNNVPTYKFKYQEDYKCLTRNLSVEDELKDIPDSVNEMGVKGMSHFFRAKCRKMQSDYDKLHSEYKSKCEELKKLQKENQKLSEDKDKWFHISAGHKTQINKLENQMVILNSKLQSKENENVSLKKDIDQLQKDLKTETVNNSNLEMRFKKTTEESEKYKVAYKNIKQQEKDLRETHKKQINEMSSVIKKIEKHKTEILNGFKKQLLLIDNIKKQKACIEQHKLCEKAENDFIKLLDWKIEN